MSVVSSSEPNPEIIAAAQDLLSYLNFSNGSQDTRVFSNWNQLFAAFPTQTLPQVYQLLQQELKRLPETRPELGPTVQATAILELVFENLLPAYWEFHQDLFFHLEPSILNQPFFLAKMAEAVLIQGEPWGDVERIIPAALCVLNDYLGFRPVAVLENGQQMEPYQHERSRPLPLFIRQVGTAVGPYQALIDRTLEFLQSLPDELTASTSFQFRNLWEMAVDLRAYDYNNPVFKRTNYLFGEWDPHEIGLDGYYHRFVVRKIILDALIDWINHQVKIEKVPAEEALYDAAAAMSGTILMASSISGSAPDSFASSISLASLLPTVARQRDFFYAYLMANVSGERAERLKKHEEATQQPFGHVRHALNMYLSSYAATQVRNRELALMYARMGFVEQSQRQAAIIPAASVRFETEIQWRLRIADQRLLAGKFLEAENLIAEVESLETRAIESGAFVDPWSILGYQGQFPLFNNREDSVPDVRVETYIDLKEQIFHLYSKLLQQAALSGDRVVMERVSQRFEESASRWDRYATTTVEDIPHLDGKKAFTSALIVSRCLYSWKLSNGTENSLVFWREHIELFDSHLAYRHVIEVLLHQQDLNAALGLMMQWLSQTDESQSVQFEESFSYVLLEWARLLQKNEGNRAQLFQRYRRTFELIEANAGPRWGVPRIIFEQTSLAPELENDDWWDEPAADVSWEQLEDEEEDAEEETPFSAAYEGVTFRDSADDGQEGNLSDGSNPWADNEFERWTRSYDPQLKFLQALAEMKEQAILAAADVLHQTQEQSGSGDAVELIPSTTSVDLAEVRKSVNNWISELSKFERELGHLLHEVHQRDLNAPSGDQDANIEYDIQLQSKLYLMHNIIWTMTRLRFVRRIGNSLLYQPSQTPAGNDGWLTSFLHAVLCNDLPSVRKMLPACLKKLSRRKLLYVPLENGGTPRSLSDAQEMHSLLRFLVTALPGLGMYRETWHVIGTALAMERSSRPRGPAITEFDRLFRNALSNTLSYLLKSASGWRSGKISDDDLIEIVSEVVDHFSELWTSHSLTMRISAAESLSKENVWEKTRSFIQKYGADLFHARNLTLGYIRTIMQTGVEEFLEYLEEQDDPLHPSPLIRDLNNGELHEDDAINQLELIYSILIDKFDRFMEYNSTTTHSDYGERFDCLLDFLKIESAYDRDDWNYTPQKIAHEALIDNGRFKAARIWEQKFAQRSAANADVHARKLRLLERKYGVKLPALNDRIEERFAKPLAINRMVALVRQTMQEQDEEKRRENFDDLRVEIENYLDGTFGTGLEVPEWLRLLDMEVRQFEAPDLIANDPYGKQLIQPVTVNLREMRKQLKTWGELTPPSKRKTKKPPGDKS